MVDKRKRSSTVMLNAAHVRSQPTAKRQQSSTPAPPQNQPTPPPPKQPDLPTSFDRNGPLPVLPEPQPDGLQMRDFRSVAESKVLQEALARSTRKWVDGDIFEKYWTKPLKSRKLDPAIIDKNPGKDTMVKLGNATMHIVPHKFDIRLFQVLRPIKEPPAPPPLLLPPPAAAAAPPSLKQQQPYQQPHQQPPLRAPKLPPQQPSPTQPGPRMQNAQPLAPPAPMLQQQTNSAAQAKVQPSQQPAVPAPQPQQQSAAPMRPAPQPAARGTGPSQQMSHQGPPHPQNTQNATQPSQPVHRPPQQHGPPQQQEPPQHSQPGRPDPVIQMLAMKASTDVKLKELMRIVASGNATGSQLQEFQGYIDTLTAASNTSPPLAPPGNQQQPPPPPPPRQMPQQAHPQQQQAHPEQQQFRGQPQPQYHPHASQPLPVQMHPMQQQQQQQQHMYQHPNPQMAMRPYQQHQQQQPLPPPLPPVHQQQHKQQQRAPAQPKSRSFPQAPKQEICGIVFEFIDPYSQGDRFRFPKHAILEHQNRGTTVIASFIVTRTPEGHEEELYQPVTIVLQSAYPRILEHLKLVVADPETTRKHMQQIMATKKRANDSFLLYRLRREPGEAVPDRAYVETRMDPPPRHGRGGGGGGGANAREAGTPMRDNKSGGNSLYPRTGPKVKHVKKHSVSNPEFLSAASNGPAPAPATAASATASCTSTAAFSSAAPGGGRDPIRSIDFSPPAEPKPPRQPKPPRSRKGRIADPTKNCRICQTSKTSLWRKADIEGENATVCNACGIKWKTNAQKQVQIAAAIAQGLPIPVFPGDEVARRSSSGGLPRPSLDREDGGGGLLWMDEEGVESVTGQVFATCVPASASTAASAPATSAIPATAATAIPATSDAAVSPTAGAGPPEHHSILRAVASVRSPTSSPSPPRLQSQSHSILRAVASVPSAQPALSPPKPTETEAVLR